MLIITIGAERILNSLQRVTKWPFTEEKMLEENQIVKVTVKVAAEKGGQSHYNGRE